MVMRMNGQEEVKHKHNGLSGNDHVDHQENDEKNRESERERENLDCKHEYMD